MSISSMVTGIFSEHLAQVRKFKRRWLARKLAEMNEGKLAGAIWGTMAEFGFSYLTMKFNSAWGYANFLESSDGALRAEYSLFNSSYTARYTRIVPPVHPWELHTIEEYRDYKEYRPDFDLTRFRSNEFNDKTLRFLKFKVTSRPQQRHQYPELWSRLEVEHHTLESGREALLVSILRDSEKDKLDLKRPDMTPILELAEETSRDASNSHRFAVILDRRDVSDYDRKIVAIQSFLRAELSNLAAKTRVLNENDGIKLGAASLRVG